MANVSGFMIIPCCSVSVIIVGLPIQGDGCAMMGRSGKLESLVKSVQNVADCPVTLKMRTGLHDNKNIAHLLMPKVKDWGLSLVTVSI